MGELWLEMSILAYTCTDEKKQIRTLYGDLSLITELKLEITLQLNKEKYLLKTELLQFKNTCTFYKVYILHPDKLCYRLLYERHM